MRMLIIIIIGSYIIDSISKPYQNPISELYTYRWFT